MLKFRAFLIAVALAAAVTPSAWASPSASTAEGREAPATPASAQAAQTVCGLAIPEPARQPPAGSAPVVFLVVPCFQKQGGSSSVEAQTYLYYIQATQSVSLPSSNRWVPYDEKVEQVILGDFKRLWATNFLDDLAIDIQDYKFANGVIGKMVVYDMEERQRVKIVDYVGSKKVEQSKIDEELKKQNLRIALDSFIDQGLIR